MYPTIKALLLLVPLIGVSSGARTCDRITPVKHCEAKVARKEACSELCAWRPGPCTRAIMTEWRFKRYRCCELLVNSMDWTAYNPMYTEVYGLCGSYNYREFDLTAGGKGYKNLTMSYDEWMSTRKKSFIEGIAHRWEKMSAAFDKQYIEPFKKRWREGNFIGAILGAVGDGIKTIVDPKQFVHKLVGATDSSITGSAVNGLEKMVAFSKRVAPKVPGKG